MAVFFSLIERVINGQPSLGSIWFYLLRSIVLCFACPATDKLKEFDYYDIALGGRGLSLRIFGG